MALINIKKKVEKSSAKLGISEPILAACTTNPAGTMKRMLSKEIGGLAGSLAAGTNGADPEHGMASLFPEGRFFLTLTDQRLLLVSMSAMTGSPKQVVSEWPRDHVEAIVVEGGTMSAPLQIAFVDGTAVQVEGAKGTDPGGVATAFAA